VAAPAGHPFNQLAVAFPARFWIPAHVAFETSLIAALVAAWPQTDVRGWLLLGFAGHVAMRVWSALDFIPKALAFERADPATITENAAAQLDASEPLAAPARSHDVRSDAGRVRHRGSHVSLLSRLRMSRATAIREGVRRNALTAGCSACCSALYGAPTEPCSAP
jgi:hypothetical protein